MLAIVTFQDLKSSITSSPGFQSSYGEIFCHSDGLNIYGPRCLLDVSYAFTLFSLFSS